ncbi:ATP-binding protein [Thermogladius sp. 4427co]|uniref:ATP-binding protein n=1 Tax=Thermogladius sp. 4427co TaxID=3450718 RepID=UPI003F7B22CF
MKSREIPVGECIPIGTVLNTVPAAEACIPMQDLNRHVLVTGATGTGKTYTVATLVNRLAERRGRHKSIQQVVLDWHGEYPGLVKHGRMVNPFQHPIPIFDPSDIHKSLDFTSQVLLLTPAQEYVMLKVLEQVYARNEYSLGVVLSILENMGDESAWFRESRLSLIRKMRRLMVGQYSRLFNGDSFHKILSTESDKPIIVDLSKIRDLSIRRLYASALLKRIFDEAVEGAYRDRNILVVVEEAKNMLGRDNYIDILVKMLSEVRKFGVGLVIVSQSPSLLVEDVMVNTSTKIIHSVKSALDLEMLGRVVNMTDEIRQVLPYLEVGEAVLFSSLYKKPLLIKVS